MFTKKQRGGFKYTFAHWCAFQMTALNHGCWRWRFLFHDWYKPWLKLFLPYTKVQKFHRTHARHHEEWIILHPNRKPDVLAMVIDWECSQYTKEACQLNARETLKERKHQDIDLAVFKAYLEAEQIMFKYNF